MESSISLTRKLHIFLRNLVRDRGSGSVEEYQKMGGFQHICTLLHVDTASGVDSTDVLRRRTAYGSNEPPKPEVTTYWGFLGHAFSEFTVLMLCGAAVVSLVLAFAYEKTVGAYAEGFAILLSVLLVTNVTAVNDYRKQAQFLRLNAAVDDTFVRCVRDGAVGDVRSADLVCGDIVQLNVGDILTVDGLLFESDGVSTDESALTGEPKLIRKSPKAAPFLLSGTKVMEGSGTFIVVAVGDNSEVGQIRQLILAAKKKPKKKSVAPVVPIEGEEEELEEENTLSAPQEKSVMTVKLDRIAILVAKSASVVALAAFIVMSVRFAVTTFAITNPDTLCVEVSDAVCASQEVWDYAPDPSVGFPLCSTVGHSSPCCTDTSDGAQVTGSPCPWMKNHLGQLLNFLITAITIFVVAVPEGLPLAVTLSLSFCVRQMMTENNLVKHLDACETMGSATTICSDKTGTLTKNRMTVVRSMVGIDPSVTFKSPLSSEIVQILSEAICLSGTADVVWNDQLKLWDQVGSKTECALLQCIKDDFNMTETYSKIRAKAQLHIVKKLPFASASKKSGFLLRTKDPQILRLTSVGASEMVLECCEFYTDAQGTITTLSSDVRKQIEQTIEEYAHLAMRTVCIAYKESADLDPETVTVNEPGLVFLALVGIEDPIRDEVPDAIHKCNRAGVDVKMVTGDNLNTAIAIARNCNIIRSTDLMEDMHTLRPNVAMTGPDFRKAVLDEHDNLRQEELDRIWPTLRVLARSSPTDKYVLVSGMIDSTVLIGDSGDRQVVAVTGDGTNDAPALKRADVGFAMGITGTAVARDAADIILMDDNFASIVVACKWGRNVFDSISKFLQFQLTVNVVAVVIAIEGAFVYNESPIGTVQMLWVNLIMNALASLALATEPPTEALLNRKPQGRNTSAISNIMRWNIAGQAMFQLLVLNLILFQGPEWLGFESGVGNGHDGPPSEHYTLMFNVLVVMQLTNQINSRKLYHELNVFRGLRNNMLFIGIVAVETAMQAIFVQLGGEWVHTEALPGWLWGVSAGIALCSFPMYLLIVFVRRQVVGRQKKEVEDTHSSKRNTVQDASAVTRAV